MTISFNPQSSLVTAPVETQFTTSARGEFYSRPISIQHWQLRDLVYCGPDDLIYCVYSHQIVCYDPRTRKSTTLQELAWHPASFCVGHGFVAAGGQSSQLALYDLARKELIFNKPLGGHVNNALHIAKSPSQEPLLFACNNDNAVKIYRLPSMQPLQIVKFKQPINYCALSPDGERLVCVSDDRKTEVLDYKDGTYHRALTFHEAADAGMSVAWNPTGTCFAAASQDGRLCVWDARQNRLVAKLSTRDACRNVKFSPGPIDLLAFTEHQNTVHIVDARNFGQRQTLSLAQHSLNEGVDICGLAFSSDGTRLYVGTEKGLAAFDINTVLRRGFEIGRIV